MTRCAEFWDKWEREPNFCGLSPQSISEIKGYLELRDKVIKIGMAKAVFYDKCPSGACRPVLRLADDGTRTEATNYIISCLKRGEKVTQGDLKGFVDMRLKKEAVCKVTPKIDRASTQMRTQEQSDAAPVTNTAPYPSLAEQMKSEPYGTQHVHPGPAAINPVIINDTHRESPFLTGNQIKAGIAGEMYPDGNSTELSKSSPVWTPVVCKTGPCPDGKTHSSFDKVRGVCCDLTGQPVNQISACAYLERQKKMAAAASSEACTITGGTIRHEMPPLVARRNSLGEIVFHPSPKQEEFIARVMRLEDLKTAEDAISTIVDQAMEMQDV